MRILDKIFKRKKQEELPPFRESSLPEDLERFRVRPPASESRFPEPRFPPAEEFRAIERPREEVTKDKTELILQKLETIDARLRLIEERLAR